MGAPANISVQATKIPQQTPAPVTVVVDSGKSWADFAGDVLDAAVAGKVSALFVVLLVVIVLMQARALWRRKR